MDFSVFIASLNSLAPEWLLLVMLVVSFASVLAMFRLFGPVASLILMPVLVITANIQVLKAVQFEGLAAYSSLFANPVALGTIVFSATYLCTDILNEIYGKTWARRAVWSGFAGYLLFVVLMLLTIGYSPLTPAQAGEDWAWNLGMQDHMAALFTPQASLLIASMAAYLTSQLFDVSLFQYIRGRTGGRFLWLRNNASTMVSTLIDNTIFTFIAFWLLSPEPLPVDVLISTYILGMYAFRLLIALIDTPVMYLARVVLRPTQNK